MATAGVLMKKVLGGAGKGVAKIANAVDDAEAVMKNAAMNATGAISDAYRTTSNAYRTTRMQSAKVIDEMEEGIRDAAGKKIKKPKIKEATKDTSKAAEEAISKPKFKDDGIRFTKDNVTYERHRNPNWQEGDARKSSTNPNGHNQFLYTANGKPISGKQFGQEKAEFVRNKGTVEQITDNAIENFLNNTIEKWDGLPNWAKYTGMATAGGIAGAVLFGGDDDNDN